MRSYRCWHVGRRRRPNLLAQAHPTPTASDQRSAKLGVGSLGVKTVGSYTMQEVYGSARAWKCSSGIHPDGDKIALTIKRLNRGSVLRARHVLLELYSRLSLAIVRIGRLPQRSGRASVAPFASQDRSPARLPYPQVKRRQHCRLPHKASEWETKRAVPKRARRQIGKGLRRTPRASLRMIPDPTTQPL